MMFVKEQSNEERPIGRFVFSTPELLLSSNVKQKKVRRIMTFKFKGGLLVATPGALTLDIDFRPYLARHFSGDWGDLSEADQPENELSPEKGFRILSAYNTPKGKIWIITEADRSVTTVLLPSEY